jgi:hypothetical protein
MILIRPQPRVGTKSIPFQIQVEILSLFFIPSGGIEHPLNES